MVLTVNPPGKAEGVEISDEGQVWCSEDLREQINQNPETPTSELKPRVTTILVVVIRLMEKIVHHLWCPKWFWNWYRNNISGIISGAGFFPATVCLHHLFSFWPFGTSRSWSNCFCECNRPQGRTFQMPPPSRPLFRPTLGKSWSDGSPMYQKPHLRCKFQGSRGHTICIESYFLVWIILTHPALLDILPPKCYFDMN